MVNRYLDILKNDPQAFTAALSAAALHQGLIHQQDVDTVNMLFDHAKTDQDEVRAMLWHVRLILQRLEAKAVAALAPCSDGVRRSGFPVCSGIGSPSF